MKTFGVTQHSTCFGFFDLTLEVNCIKYFKSRLTFFPQQTDGVNTLVFHNI